MRTAAKSRVLLATTVLGFAGALACSGTPMATSPATTVVVSPSTTSVATVVSTAGPPPTTTPSPNTVAVCRAVDIVLTRGRSDAALGHFGQWFEFTNTGGTCTLTGYPQMLGLDDAGTWEPVPARQNTDGYIGPPPAIGPLDRNSSASLLLQGTNRAFYPNGECPTGPKQPPHYRREAFVLPGDPGRVEVDGEISGLCDLAISPFGATSR